MPTNQPKLTPKQKIFVAEVAKGKSGTQAALVAYDTTDENSAKTIASQNLSKLNVKEALEPILAKHDINLNTAIAPIGKGLKALKMNEFTGEVTEDIKLQMQASDRALKLLGVNQDVTGNTYNFINVANEQKEKYGI